MRIGYRGKNSRCEIFRGRGETYRTKRGECRDGVAVCFDEGVKNVNAYEAEKAFREQLECETVHTDINTMKIRSLGAPVGLQLERHESQVVLTFLVFKTGVKSVSRYSCEKVRVVGDHS